MLSAAGSLRWFRDALAPGIPFAALFAEAGRVAPGSDGLLFLPYLSGERSPHPDPLARGAFVGLTLGHERPHLTRAVLEGVAFGLRDGLDLMIAAGMAAPTTIRASGGGTASPVWRQILADVLGRRHRDRRRRPRAPRTVAQSSRRSEPAGHRIVADATSAWVSTDGSASPGEAAAAYRDRHAAYRAVPGARRHLPRG